MDLASAGYSYKFAKRLTKDKRKKWEYAGMWEINTVRVDRVQGEPPKTRRLSHKKEGVRKMDKKIMKLCLIAVMLFAVFGFTGCNQKTSKYIDAEHIQRVTERIQARYIDGDERLRPYDKPTDDGEIYPKVKATDFAVYPLYDENDDLKYFLVEFQPFGYLYVLLRNEQLKGFSWLGASTSMYMLSSTEGEPAWTPYTIDIANSTDEIWEIDENGKKIAYAQSPFSVRGIENEKRYLLNFDGYIPAVRREGKFENLISNSEFEVSNGQITEKQPIASISFTNKKHFDL